MPSKNANMTNGLWFQDMPEPAILKPKPLWTGKQLMSLLMPSDVTFTKAVRNASVDLEGLLSDNVIVVRKGIHLAGRLCKATLGTSTGGFVQTVWKLHGAWAAAKFVSDAQRILIRHLTQDTVCISIRDTVQTDDT
jgi:DNA-directed RNA polymerase II subunit RPB1